MVCLLCEVVKLAIIARFNFRLRSEVPREYLTMIISSYLIAGMFAGLVAGLLGVGGGIIVVPVLILLFEAQGFGEQVLTHMAIGTSLATIVFTSLSSTLNHHRLGSVAWPVLRPLSPGIVLGAIAGVLLATELEGRWLQTFIGGFASLTALKMFMGGELSVGRELPKPAQLGVAGIVIGGVSAMLGIGGGTLSVPFLSRYRLPMKQIIGTAAACGLPIALAGALTNVGVGLNVAGRPPWSAGFVYVPALLAISAASIVFAGVGAQLAHRIPATFLRRLFSFALLIVGIKFLIY